MSAVSYPPATVRAIMNRNDWNALVGLRLSPVIATTMLVGLGFVLSVVGCAEGTLLPGGIDGEGGDTTSGNGGMGGFAGVSSSNSSAASTGSSMSGGPSSSAASSSSGGSSFCNLNHLVISEIRSRGALGTSDELVELFNASSTFVTLDSTWAIEGRSAGGSIYTTRWQGSTGTIPAYGHFLIGGPSYAQSPSADDSLLVSLTDATSLRLVHAGAVVDAVCYYFNAGTMAAFTAEYTCEGVPTSNSPHDDSASAASSVDVSIERLPGGSSGNCVDTDDNASDFYNAMPATPMNLQSPPTP